jgi:hypothetical protein
MNPRHEGGDLRDAFRSEVTESGHLSFELAKQ